MSGKYRTFNDIDNVRKNAFWLIVLSLIVMALVSVFAMYKIDNVNERAKANAYVLHKGTRVGLEPLTDLKRNLQILIEGHVERYHHYFFQLEPDMRMIKRNIEDNALYMVDDSGRRFYNRLVEEDFYKDIVMRGFRYEFDMDSLNVDYSDYPFPFTMYGNQTIEKGNRQYRKRLVTTGRLKTTGVTTKNLNGVKILEFHVANNESISR